MIKITGNFNYKMITCYIRYKIDPKKLEEFKKYSKVWTKLIEKYGGNHLGYFLPIFDKSKKPSSTFSFSKIGCEGPQDIAIAIFNFPSIEDYEFYRKAVGKDLECINITKKFEENPCFISYERWFLEKL